MLVVCTLFAATAQQTSLRVDFRGHREKPAAVGVISRKGIVFASADDLAAVLGLSGHKSHQTLELSASKSRLKLTALNPFIIASDAAHRQTILQLSTEVLYSAGVFFVPLRSFLEAASHWLPSSVEYDDQAGVLLVGPEGTAKAYDISTVEMETKTNGMAIRIPLSAEIRNVEHWLRPDGWLYLTIADARADVASLNATSPEGLVKKVVAIQSPGSVQLSFKLRSAPESEELTRDPSTGDVIVTLRMPGSVKPPPPLDDPVRNGLEQKRDRWAMDVIVIDPGHGGKDWGALGVSGVREKDVTLGIALKLGKLVKRNLSDVRVVYTRSDDRFIELDRRGKIANEADGKLFISIHCNSLPRKPSPTRGFEVYLLRPGRTNEAVAIAERENAVIQLEEGYEERYKHLTDENFILVTMAQSAYVRSSEVFADVLQQEMESHAGVPNRGVKQAGFYVLVGASMPNVLVETAYLSNRQDERFLKSESGQQKIAESIYAAVKMYKQRYEKLLEEGKPIGEGTGSPSDGR